MISNGTKRKGVKMNIKVELLKNYISDYISGNIRDLNIDANEIADTSAINMLREIQQIIKNDDYSDFEMVDEITCVFEKYKIDFGSCHDF